MSLKSLNTRWYLWGVPIVIYPELYKPSVWFCMWQNLAQNQLYSQTIRHAISYPTHLKKSLKIRGLGSSRISGPHSLWKESQLCRRSSWDGLRTTTGIPPPKISLATRVYPGDLTGDCLGEIDLSYSEGIDPKNIPGLCPMRWSFHDTSYYEITVLRDLNTVYTFGNSLK